jgi:uncharacterized protein YggE
MKHMILPALLLAASAVPAAAQVTPVGVPTIAPTSTLLTVSAQGKSTRQPDLAVFNAGVTTQGATAGEALAANSTAMTRVVASLKRAGVAERDIQTSNLSISPIYAPPVRQPDGSYNQSEQRITGYTANNSVSVRQRKLGDYGKVIDALVAAGANQVNGPSFQLDDDRAAADEARVDALKTARARADLYARTAGMRVVRIVSINEGGGYIPPQPVMYRMAEVAAAPPPPPAPIQPGELEVGSNVTVQFELAP